MNGPNGQEPHFLFRDLVLYCIFMCIFIPSYFKSSFYFLFLFLIFIFVSLSLFLFFHFYYRSLIFIFFKVSYRRLSKLFALSTTCLFSPF